MNRRRFFGRSRTTLLVLVAASLLLITLDFRDSGIVKSGRNTVGSLFSPFASVGNLVASPFKNGWKGITSYDELADENVKLKDEIAKAKADDISEAGAKEEVEELKAMLGLSRNTKIDHAIAKVTSGPLTSFDSTFEINKGSGDGIKAGMVVISPGGLVGRVERAFGGRAKIRVIVDPEYPGFGVVLAASGEVATATSGSNSMLSIESGISKEAQVKRGDAVLTSGLEGSAYPPDLPVGKVLSVGKTGDGTEQTAVVEPSADLEGLRTVMVLLCADDCA